MQRRDCFGFETTAHKWIIWWWHFLLESHSFACISQGTRGAQLARQTREYNLPFILTPQLLQNHRSAAATKLSPALPLPQSSPIQGSPVPGYVGATPASPGGLGQHHQQPLLCFFMLFSGQKAGKTGECYQQLKRPEPDPQIYPGAYIHTDFMWALAD